MTDQIIAPMGAPPLVKKRLENILKFLESLPIRYCEGVIAMCDDLAAEVSRFKPRRLLILKDVSLINSSSTQPVSIAKTSREQIVMYVGNLESYQGIDLLLGSFARAISEYEKPAKLVIVGGTDQHINTYRDKAKAYGIDSRVDFVGPQPLNMLARYTSNADVLVSPRVRGTNTPMKIYSYLDSGAAVLATDLPMHTQVVDDSIAMLAPPNPTDFSVALLKLLTQPELRSRLAANAQTYARNEHSFDRFKRHLTDFFDELDGVARA